MQAGSILGPIIFYTINKNTIILEITIIFKWIMIQKTFLIYKDNKLSLKPNEYVINE